MHTSRSAASRAGRGSAFAAVLGEGEDHAYFAYNVAPGVRSVGISLPELEQADPSWTTPPSRLTVYRTDGQSLAQFAISRLYGRSAIRLERSGSAGADTLILGISREVAAGESDSIAAPATTFLFQIETSPNPAPREAGDPAARSAEVNQDASPRWSPIPRLDDDSSAGAWEDGGSAIPGLGQDGVERLPLRSSGPSVGPFGDGPTAPRVPALDAALVDLSFLDLSPDLDPTNLLEPVNPSLLASPGGFPMIGSMPLDPNATGDEHLLTLPEKTLTLPWRADSERARRPTFALALGVVGRGSRSP